MPRKKLLDTLKKIRVNITIKKWVDEILLRAGGGNRSKGIEVAAQAWHEKQGK